MLSKAVGLYFIVIYLPFWLVKEAKFWWQNRSFSSLVVLFLLGILGYSAFFLGNQFSFLPDCHSWNFVVCSFGNQYSKECLLARFGECFFAFISDSKLFFDIVLQPKCFQCDL